MSEKKYPLTIGKLAKNANVNIETIRYYQRQGLITEPLKPLNGFRHYPLADIDKIRFIKRAQQLGFSLKEIQQLLTLGEQQCNDVQNLAIEKRDKIKNQISGLLTIQSALNDLISTCNNNPDLTHCSFIDALFQQGFFDH